MTDETKTCQNCKKEFLIEPEDFQFYKKIHVPPPTWCPNCRLQRRLTWRNMRSLYKRKCDLCKKEKIGMYAPDKPYKIYCSPCWWGDGWEALDYGRDYDFSRPFFEQFEELMQSAPLVGRFVFEDTMVNSDYTNMGLGLKNCYLAFNAGTDERVCYSNSVHYSNDCLDVAYCSKSELCYECSNIQNCYRLFYSKDCSACQDSFFLNNCIGCSSCFGCVNLRNKQYHIFNQPYTKESYFRKLEELGFDSGSYRSVSSFRQEVRPVWESAPMKYYHGIRNTNVSGDYINNCKNTRHSFHIADAEDVKFCAYLMFGGSVKDSYDWTQYGEKGELIYELLQAGDSIYNNHFGWCIWHGTRNIEYGILNVRSSDCFGCVGVKDKRFCIFNKQYSEDDYRKLRQKIIAHMSDIPYTDKQGRIYTYGEFFPPELSPFGYNETTAPEEFELTESEARERGYKWVDAAAHRGVYAITKDARELPDHIKNIEDGILSEIIGCAQCGAAYRLTKLELDFYRNQKVPLPHLCFECRYKRRLHEKNPSRLWQRRCMCLNPDVLSRPHLYQNSTSHFHNTSHCPNEFETSYAPERPEIVYCEQCYNSDVV